MRYYVSHSIRGAKGVNATPMDMKNNCDRIIKVCKQISEALPNVDLYIPALHEDFVAIAFHDKYLTEQQVLKIDCKIVDNCDGVIVFSPDDDMMQGGRAVEYNHAIVTGKPAFIFGYVEEAISWLTHQIVRS